MAMGNAAHILLMGVTFWVLLNAGHATDQAVSFDLHAGFWPNGQEVHSLGANR
jgi:hypothetical protein